MWRLWSTTSADGTEKNGLVQDQDWMPFSKVFTYTANSIFPVIFEIKDSGNEVARVTAYPNITAPSADSTQMITVLRSRMPESTKLAYLESNALQDDSALGEALEYLANGT
jgi:hypothetical protein